MQIYRLAQYLTNCKKFILEKNNVISMSRWMAHIDFVEKRHNLNIDDQNIDNFYKVIKEYMNTNDIYAVLTDETNKEVYVRVSNKMPSRSGIKALKDWAIEHGYSEDIKFDKFVWA